MTLTAWKTTGQCTDHRFGQFIVEVGDQQQKKSNPQQAKILFGYYDKWGAFSQQSVMVNFDLCSKRPRLPGDIDPVSQVIEDINPSVGINWLEKTNWIFPHRILFHGSPKFGILAAASDRALQVFFLGLACNSIASTQHWLSP
jgi:hypothetical protein